MQEGEGSFLLELKPERELDLAFAVCGQRNSTSRAAVFCDVGAIKHHKESWRNLHR